MVAGLCVRSRAKGLDTQHGSEWDISEWCLRSHLLVKSSAGLAGFPDCPQAIYGNLGCAAIPWQALLGNGNPTHWFWWIDARPWAFNFCDSVTTETHLKHLEGATYFIWFQLISMLSMLSGETLNSRVETLNIKLIAIRSDSFKLGECALLAHLFISAPTSLRWSLIKELLLLQFALDILISKSCPLGSGIPLNMSLWTRESPWISPFCTCISCDVSNQFFLVHMSWKDVYVVTESAFGLRGPFSMRSMARRGWIVMMARRCETTALQQAWSQQLWSCLILVGPLVGPCWPRFGLDLVLGSVNVSKPSFLKWSMPDPPDSWSVDISQSWRSTVWSTESPEIILDNCSKYSREVEKMRREQTPQNVDDSVTA